MEKKYDLSFMKEYAELYNLSDLELSNMFKIDGRVVIGYNAIKKYLSGEKQISESIMEEILYELNYKDFESFKAGILKKIALKNNIKKDEKVEIVKPEPKKEIEKKVVFNDNIATNNILEAVDFNKMKNLDRIIVSLLCDETLSIGNKEIAEFLNVSEEYVRNIYKEILHHISTLIDKEEESYKQKKLNK